MQHTAAAAAAAAAAAKSLQSCPTLGDPRDGSPPGSPVPGILQARIVEWVAISFSSAWKWKLKVKSLSRVRLLATPWTVAYQAPPSMGFSRHECWSGVPLPAPSTLLHISKLVCRCVFTASLWKLCLTEFSDSGKSMFYLVCFSMKWFEMVYLGEIMND